MSCPSPFASRHWRCVSRTGMPGCRTAGVLRFAAVQPERLQEAAHPSDSGHDHTCHGCGRPPLGCRAHSVGQIHAQNGRGGEPKRKPIASPLATSGPTCGHFLSNTVWRFPYSRTRDCVLLEVSQDDGAEFHFCYSYCFMMYHLRKSPYPRHLLHAYSILFLDSASSLPSASEVADMQTRICKAQSAAPSSSREFAHEEHTWLCTLDAPGYAWLCRIFVAILL